MDATPPLEAFRRQLQLRDGRVEGTTGPGSPGHSPGVHHADYGHIHRLARCRQAAFQKALHGAILRFAAQLGSQVMDCSGVLLVILSVA
eukprot:14117994-Heterocapsa_arctica.AAC.1